MKQFRQLERLSTADVLGRTVLVTLQVVSILWSGAAVALSPASAEQMACVPSAFVVATFAPDSPIIRISDNCKGPSDNCQIPWSAKIRVDQVLAATPSDLTPENIALLDVGSVIPVTINIHPTTYLKELMPAPNPTGIFTPPLPEEQLTELIRNHQFIIGLGADYGNTSKPIASDQASQVWSLSSQGLIERTLLRAASSQQTGRNDNHCATLDEKKVLQDAVAAHPNDSAALISLAKLYERISQGADKDRETANDLFTKAAKVDGSTGAIAGFMRTLGSYDAAWSVEGIALSQFILNRDPNNLAAKRLSDQSYIHEGRLNLIETADLSDAVFEVLDLSTRELPHKNLHGAIIKRLDAYETNLSYADLGGAQIESVNLSRANLHYANLKGADLDNASLVRANLSGVVGLKKIYSDSANGASFKGADLNDVELRIQQARIQFPTAPYYAKWLDHEDDQPRLSRKAGPAITFAHAKLRNAQLWIDGLRIDFSGADLTETKIERSDLRGADFTGAKLDKTTFPNDVYDCTTKWPQGFSPGAVKLIPMPGPQTCKNPLPLIYDGLWLLTINFATLDLRNASFRHAVAASRFVGTDLSGADLRDADFSEALLENADLANARFNAATKWPAGFDPVKAGAKLCVSDSRGDCS